MSLPAWQQHEITLTATRDVDQPYVSVNLVVEFTHSTGRVIGRPGFWDGGRTWRVRFTSPESSGAWTWRTFCDVPESGLAGHSGSVICDLPQSDKGIFARRGFWRMSPGGRNLVHADGTPSLIIGDTAWGLPWRATPEEVRVYAADRHAKGFNAALLMTVQPDMRASGPRDRSAPMGFDVGFEDLPQGSLQQLNPDYFQYFDQLVAILLAHDIVPVYQPIFHGYGWKGLSVAGNVVSNDDYVRYCRYLVARYGAAPAVWLVGGDGSGYLPSVRAGGEEVERWDAYAQPAGIHYRPHADNKACQADNWLDFQWCQTGHNGEHVPERVAHMWHEQPVKAIANGEPTYEQIGVAGRAAGWWQGHEAWCNLTAGGTMGVVYGAGSLWQWRHAPNEPDYEAWAYAHQAGWREALDFEGSRYPGVLQRIFADLPFADMAPNWDWTIGRRGLGVPGKLLVVYLSEGGRVHICSEHAPKPYRVHDARTGEVLSRGVHAYPENGFIETPAGVPTVVVCCDGV
jgi:Protein of unknown function (DUF4038)/Domain of unknown function (DUF5060)